MNSTYLPEQFSIPMQVSKKLFHKLKNSFSKKIKEKKAEEEKKPPTLKEQGAPTKEQIVDLLRIYRTDYMIMKETELSRIVTQEQFDKEIADKVLLGGVVVGQVGGLSMHGANTIGVHGVMNNVQCAAPALAGAGPWIIAGFVYTAKTGLDYRRYK